MKMLPQEALYRDYSVPSENSGDKISLSDFEGEQNSQVSAQNYVNTFNASTPSVESTNQDFLNALWDKLARTPGNQGPGGPVRSDFTSDYITNQAAPSNPLLKLAFPLVIAIAGIFILRKVLK